MSANKRMVKSYEKRLKDSAEFLTQAQLTALVKLGNEAYYEILCTLTNDKVSEEDRKTYINTILTDKDYDPGFDGPAMLNAHLGFQTQRKLVSTTIKARSGNITCPKCQGNNISIETVQTRSADEPFNLKCTCTTCGNRWTKRG